MALFIQEKVACGKTKCGKCAGHKLVHGPYWYAYWRDDKSKMRKRYMGKVRADRWGPGNDSTTPPPKTVRSPKKRARKRKGAA